MEKALSSGAGSGLSPAFVKLLPEVFRVIFERIDETRRDIANAHLEILRPFLAQHGVTYERQKFAERLAAGQASLSNAQAWLRDVISARAASASQLEALARGDSRAHKQLIGDALLQLIRLPVRLDTAKAKLPETLLYDGRRLAGVRDELDRLSLVAVYSMLLRQFLANQRVPVEGTGVLETRLYTILQNDEGVRLLHLVDEVSQPSCPDHGKSGPTNRLVGIRLTRLLQCRTSSPRWWSRRDGCARRPAAV